MGQQLHLLSVIVQFKFVENQLQQCWSQSLTAQSMKLGSIIILTFCTSKSSIIQVASTEIKISNPIMLAVHESWFSAITDQVIQEDGTSSLTKEGIVQWCSSCGKSNKVQNYSGLRMSVHWNKASTYTYQLIWSQAVCRPLLHQMLTKNHHTQCPMSHSSKSPHDPHRKLFHSLAWCLRSGRALECNHTRKDHISLMFQDASITVPFWGDIYYLPLKWQELCDYVSVI